MFHLQNFKTMKANVQISAVKKEFKNGQQGWQVFVDGMEGRLRCEMNFKDSLKAMRYCFLLSKRLDLQINDIQLAALSLDYQRAKAAVDTAVEDATKVAGEVAAEVGEAEAEPTEAPAPESEELVRTPNNVHVSQYEELKRKHPDALLLFRCGDFYECYDEHAEKAAECLGITLTVRNSTGRKMAGFPYHALDTYLPKLIRAGHRVAICDQLEEPKGSAKVVEMVEPASKKRSSKKASVAE
jgi:hypothetical protein